MSDQEKQSEGFLEVNKQEEREPISMARVYASVKREKSELFSEKKPVPVWMFVVCALVLFMAGQKFGAKVEGDLSDIRPMSAGAGPELSPYEKMLKEGKTVYLTCAGCHQPSGQGQPGVFPPLAGSKWVTEGNERLIQIILHGLQGPIMVKGQNYVSAMPAQGGVLSDKDVASVATFVRNQWGNEAEMVTPEMVAAAREKHKARQLPWTVAELAAEDANMPGAPAE